MATAKLSKLQLNVIELMQNGYKCRKKRYGGYCIISSNGNDYISCPAPTIDKLKSLNILSDSLQLITS